MNYNRVHSLFSKATEAIVTSDGKIKRRLNSYETVVQPGQNDPFYIPDGAVNDNYGNLNHLTAIIRDRSVSSRLSQLRYAMYGAFTLVVVLFSWSAYNFLIPNLSATSDDEQSQNSLGNDLASTVHETQLERVANLVIGDNDWNNDRIDLFMKHWNASNDDAREFFKTTAWFQHFSYRLETKFNRAIYTGELFAGITAAEKHPVYALALAVGVADPNMNYAANLEKNKNYSQLETAVTKELAKMEESKLQENRQDDLVVADEQALAKLLKGIDGKPILPKEEIPVKSKPEQTASTNIKSKQPPAVKEPQVTVAALPAISEQEVSRVIQKYASAYEKGNLKELSTLFGVNDPTQGKRIVEQLKANYENIFANSKKRTVNFNGINWRFDGNQATINSNYRSQIELKDNKGTQTITANARVDLLKTNNEIKISSFELLNRSVSVVTPELTLPTVKHSVREKPANPTAAELQDIVTRLVSSYESGDLQTFSSLFSPNAKTNDRQNLKGIKADYEELFKTSNDRQMFIQGMQWSFDENYAKGTGDLEAIVLSRGDNSVYSMGGKIQLVAQRIDGKVRITHMYHIERKK